MSAVVLAAGLGERLGQLTQSCPKGLLTVDGAPLLVHSLRRLSAAGLGRCLIVVGHAAGLIEAALGAEVGGVSIRYVQNEAYRREGSASSLACAVERIDDGRVLLLESDILYHRSFLDAGLGSSGSVVLAADRSGSGDEVHVGLSAAGRLAHLSKRLPSVPGVRAVPGEFSGISLLDGDAVAFLKAWVAAGREGWRGDYEDVLLGAAARVPVTAAYCPGLPWCEVDTPRDLARARSVTALRLRAEDPSRPRRVAGQGRRREGAPSPQRVEALAGP